MELLLMGGLAALGYYFNSNNTNNGGTPDRGGHGVPVRAQDGARPRSLPEQQHDEEYLIAPASAAAGLHESFAELMEEEDHRLNSGPMTDVAAGAQGVTGTPFYQERTVNTFSDAYKQTKLDLYTGNSMSVFSKPAKQDPEPAFRPSESAALLSSDGRPITAMTNEKSRFWVSNKQNFQDPVAEAAKIRDAPLSYQDVLHVRPDNPSTRSETASLFPATGAAAVPMGADMGLMGSKTQAGDGRREQAAAAAHGTMNGRAQVELKALPGDTTRGREASDVERHGAGRALGQPVTPAATAAAQPWQQDDSGLYSHFSARDDGVGTHGAHGTSTRALPAPYMPESRGGAPGDFGDADKVTRLPIWQPESQRTSTQHIPATMLAQDMQRRAAAAPGPSNRRQPLQQQQQPEASNPTTPDVYTSAMRVLSVGGRDDDRRDRQFVGLQPAIPHAEAFVVPDRHLRQSGGATVPETPSCADAPSARKRAEAAAPADAGAIYNTFATSFGRAGISNMAVPLHDTRRLQSTLAPPASAPMADELQRAGLAGKDRDHDDGGKGLRALDMIDRERQKFAWTHAEGFVDAAPPARVDGTAGAPHHDAASWLAPTRTFVAEPLQDAALDPVRAGWDEGGVEEVPAAAATPTVTRLMHAAAGDATVDRWATDPGPVRSGRASDSVPPVRVFDDASLVLQQPLTARPGQQQGTFKRTEPVAGLVRPNVQLAAVSHPPVSDDGSDEHGGRAVAARRRARGGWGTTAAGAAAGVGAEHGAVLPVSAPVVAPVNATTSRSTWELDPSMHLQQQRSIGTGAAHLGSGHAVPETQVQGRRDDARPRPHAGDMPAASFPDLSRRLSFSDLPKQKVHNAEAPLRELAPQAGQHANAAVQNGNSFAVLSKPMGSITRAPDACRDAVSSAAPGQTGAASNVRAATLAPPRTDHILENSTVPTKVLVAHTPGPQTNLNQIAHNAGPDKLSSIGSVHTSRLELSHSGPQTHAVVQLPGVTHAGLSQQSLTRLPKHNAADLSEAFGDLAATSHGAVHPIATI